MSGEVIQFDLQRSQAVKAVEALIDQGVASVHYIDMGLAVTEYITRSQLYNWDLGSFGLIGCS